MARPRQWPKNLLVFGVNPQSAQKHQKFREKFHFPFPLLVDKGQKVAELYKANGLIVKRTVYLIGPDGKILFAQRGMPNPAEVLAKLTREPVSTKGNGGTGMGLMFCQRVMQSVGGSIEIDSREGEGTTVTLYFRPGESVR